jgi:CDGSH-type Zn-finger protein
MSSNYKATCRCGASIDVPYSDNFKEWNTFHRECLKVQPQQEEAPKQAFSVESYNKGFDAGYDKGFKEAFKEVKKDD